MGARPSSFKKGGGYLNEVDATIVGYTFEIGDTTTIKSGNRKGEDFTPFSLVPQFEVDGDDESKEEPKTQRLLIGDAVAMGATDEDNESLLEEDGQVWLTPDGQGIGSKSEAGIFLASLVEGGFDENLFDDDDERVDFRPMIGTRVRLVQEINEEKTKRQGKQKSKKNGKEYDRKDLKVATVHALPGAAPKGAKASSGKAAPAAAKGKDAKGGKSAKKADISEKAIETLKGLLADAKDNTIVKGKLSMAVLKALTKDSDREAVREWLFDDDNLAGIDGVEFNAKKGSIKLVDSDDEDEDDE